MRNVLLMSLSVLGVAGCGSDRSDAEAERAAEDIVRALGETMEEPAAPAPAPSGSPAAPAPAPAPAPAGASNFGSVSLSPGFMPDPHVVEGTSGGAIAANTFNPSCVGHVSATPDHLLVAGGAFTRLRVLAQASEDVTLVVQKPDGSYVCNDDSEGTNPIVTLDNAPAGTYRVWIGSYMQGQSARYRLGFTELATATPSSLASG